MFIKKLNGISYYENEFKKDSKTILFIHGSGCNKELFKAFFKELNEYNLISIDLPGHGDSDNTGYSFDNYVNSTEEFIKCKGLSDVIVVGHSLGATLAVKVASLNLPNVVGCVSLSGGAYYPSLNHSFLNKIHKGKVDKIWILKACDSLYKLDVLKALMHIEPNKVIIEDFLIDEKLDVRDCLKNIKVPTKILVGDKDNVALPEYSIFMHDEIKNSELIIMKGYKHMMFLGNKDTIIEAIKSMC